MYSFFPAGHFFPADRWFLLFGKDNPFHACVEDFSEQIICVPVVNTVWFLVGEK